MKKFSEMKFKRPNLKKIEADMGAITEEFSSAESFEAANKALKKMFKYSDRLETNFSIAYVKYTCDTTDPKNIKNQELVDEIGPQINVFVDRFNKALVSSKFRPELEEKWGKHLFNMAQTKMEKEEKL